MKTDMKVSVVIPVYNEEKYIETCLKSLMDQKDPADEIIVVDNNSTDNTVALAKKYPVKIIKEKKQGIIPARNRGYDEAQYDIIARTDADVKVPPDWIKKIRAAFTKRSIDALSGPVVFYDFPHKTPTYATFYFDFMRTLQSGSETLIGPNMSLRKSTWEKVKKSLCTDDALVHEDQDLAIHIAAMGGKIRVDHTLMSHASARRLLHNPRSFFIEYPRRLVRTHKDHVHLQA